MISSWLAQILNQFSMNITNLFFCAAKGQEYGVSGKEPFFLFVRFRINTTGITNGSSMKRHILNAFHHAATCGACVAVVIFSGTLRRQHERVQIHSRLRLLLLLLLRTGK